MLLAWPHASPPPHPHPQGNYDRCEAMLASGTHPCDLLLLMACSEGDDGKVNEMLKAGANPNVKVRLAPRLSPRAAACPSPAGQPAGAVVCCSVAAAVHMQRTQQAAAAARVLPAHASDARLLLRPCPACPSTLAGHRRQERDGPGDKGGDQGAAAGRQRDGVSGAAARPPRPGRSGAIAPWRWRQGSFLPCFRSLSYAGPAGPWA